MSTFFRQRPARILFGALVHDLQGLHTALEAGADFAGCHLRQEGGALVLTAPETTAAGGTAPSCPPEPSCPLDPILALCRARALPLCLLVRARDLPQGPQALLALLEATSPCPDMLLAADDMDLLAEARRRLDGGCWATGLVLAGDQACALPGATRTCADLHLLARDLACGCRLCGLRSSGLVACVIGQCSPQEVLRMSIDGADSFLMDDPAPLLAHFRKTNR